jgi:hypothetical protein
MKGQILLGWLVTHHHDDAKFNLSHGDSVTMFPACYRATAAVLLAWRPQIMTSLLYCKGAFTRVLLPEVAS